MTMPVRNATAFAACIGLGIALHFFVTLNVGGFPARLALADLVLPVCLGFAVLQHEASPLWQRLRSWRHGWFLPFLIACTAWLLASILIGRVYTGRWIGWAVVQKGLGWFVLMGYLAVGASFAAGAVDRRLSFARYFIGTAWAIALFSLAIYLAWLVNPEFTFLDRFDARVEGFFDNPNAFGIAMVALFGMQLVLMRYRLISDRLVSRWGLALLVAVILFSRSRSAWLALLPMLVPLLWLRAIELRTLIGGVARGAILVGAIYGAAVAVGWLGQYDIASSAPSSVSMSAHLISAPITDSGVNHRIQIMKTAMELWREAPIFGIGLGSFYAHELARGGNSVIHTSALWLLTETGVVGLILFGILFYICVVTLWRETRNADPWAATALAVVIALAVSSLGTEIIYQRYLWLVLGMGMIKPRPSVAGNH